MNLPAKQNAIIESLLVAGFVVDEITICLQARDQRATVIVETDGAKYFDNRQGHAPGQSHSLPFDAAGIIEVLTSRFVPAAH